MFAADAEGDDERYADGDPGDAFEAVEELVAAEGELCNGMK